MTIIGKTKATCPECGKSISSDGPRVTSGCWHATLVCDPSGQCVNTSATETVIFQR